VSNRRKREDTEKMDPVVQEKLVDATRPLATTPDGIEVLPSVILNLGDEITPTEAEAKMVEEQELEERKDYLPGVTPGPKPYPRKYKRATTPTIPINQEKPNMSEAQKPFNPLTQPPTPIGCGGDLPPPSRNLNKAELMPVINPAPDKDYARWGMFLVMMAALAGIIALLLVERCEGNTLSDEVAGVQTAVNSVKADTVQLDSMNDDLKKVVKETGKDGDLYKEQLKTNQLLATWAECRGDLEQRLKAFLALHEQRLADARATIEARKRARQADRQREVELMAVVSDIHANGVIVKDNTDIIRYGVTDLNNRPGPVVNLTAVLDESGKLVITQKDGR